MGKDNFWKEDAKSLRYIQHQFQDYGYRLAMKLGDVPHKAIYIKLAKTAPRHLVEQAASFASDYRNELNKGKLFMWKLKKLREEEEEKARIQDFGWLFSWHKSMLACEALAVQIAKKEQERLPAYLNLIKQINPYLNLIAKPKVFDPLAGIGLDSNIWSTFTKKYTAWESRRGLIKLSAVKLIYKKDILQALTKLKPNSFNIVWMTRLWDLVPLSTQPLLVENLKPTLEFGALVITASKIAEPKSEHWDLMDNGANGTKLWIYHQQTNLEALRETFKDFELLDTIDFDGIKQAFVWRYVGE